VRFYAGCVSITVEPMTATIGAEIGGVDLAGDPSPETVAQIRAALLDHRVPHVREGMVETLQRVKERLER